MKLQLCWFVDGWWLLILSVVCRYFIWSTTCRPWVWTWVCGYFFSPFFSKDLKDVKWMYLLSYLMQIQPHDPSESVKRVRTRRCIGGCICAIGVVVSSLASYPGYPGQFSEYWKHCSLCMPHSIQTSAARCSRPVLVKDARLQGLIS